MGGRETGHPCTPHPSAEQQQVFPVAVSVGTPSHRAPARDCSLLLFQERSCSASCMGRALLSSVSFPAFCPGGSFPQSLYAFKTFTAGQMSNAVSVCDTCGAGQSPLQKVLLQEYSCRPWEMAVPAAPTNSTSKSTGKTSGVCLASCPAQSVSQDMAQALLPSAPRPPQHLPVQETGEHHPENSALEIPITFWSNSLSAVFPKEHHLLRANKCCFTSKGESVGRQGGIGACWAWAVPGSPGVSRGGSQAGQEAPSL